MSEDLAFGLFLLEEFSPEVFQRVGHQEVCSVVKSHEFLVLLVVGVLLGLLPPVFHAIRRYVALLLVNVLLALVAVGLAHPFLYLFGACRDVHRSQCPVLHLSLVFLLESLQLFHGHASLEELGHDVLS